MGVEDAWVTESGVLKMNHPFNSLGDDVNVSFDLWAHVLIVASLESAWA